jgi:hypothetical protein
MRSPTPVTPEEAKAVCDGLKSPSGRSVAEALRSWPEEAIPSPNRGQVQPSREGGLNMLSDVCAQFLYDTGDILEDGALVKSPKKISAARMRKCAARLVAEVRTSYDDGYYGMEPKAVLKAARDVVKASHDTTAVSKLRGVAEAVRAFHDCCPSNEVSPPAYVRYENDCYETMMEAIQAVLEVNSMRLRRKQRDIDDEID